MNDLKDDSSIPIVLPCCVESDKLWKRIVEGIAQRREGAVRQGIDFDRLARGEVAPVTNASFWDRLRIYQDRIYVQPSRAERFSTGIGLLDRVLAFVRRELHGVALFYCNRLGQRQMLFNREILQLLLSLNNLNHSLGMLNTRVERLERRVLEMEALLRKDTRSVR